MGQQDRSSRPKWVVLIYLAGDNNLSEECVYALNQMRQVCIENHGKRSFEVIVQFDPVGRGNPTRRFQIHKPPSEDDYELGFNTTKGDDKNTLEDDEMKTKRRLETDTGSPEALLAFLLDSIEEFSADHYMVILAGHGAGSSEGFFLQDDARPLSTIPSSFPVDLLKQVFKDADLQNVLKTKGSNIDILGFDACMMSTLEISYQLRDIDILNLVIGSEGFTLNTGWPYKEILSILSKQPEIRPEHFARKIVDEYIRFYRDYYLGGLSVDMSVIRLARIYDLVEEIDELACELKAGLCAESHEAVKAVKGTKNIVDDGQYDNSGCKPFQDALILSHWAAQSYNGEQCVDLYDFCRLLRERMQERLRERWPSLYRRCKSLMDMIVPIKPPQDGLERLVEKSCYTGAAFQYSHGVSIYFPWADLDLDPSYEQLDFGEDSTWLDFLKVYLKATKRKVRRDSDQRFAASKRNNLMADGRGGPFRATPPGNKGTDGRVHTMRNPPTAFVRNTCPKEDGQKHADSGQAKYRAPKRGSASRKKE